GDRCRSRLLRRGDGARRADRQSPVLTLPGRDRGWYNKDGDDARRRRSERGLRERAARAVPREPGRGSRRMARALRERRERARRGPPGPRAARRAAAGGRQRSRRRRAAAPAAVEAPAPDQQLFAAVAASMALVTAYRTYGHLAARLDPLGGEPVGDPA